MYKESFSIFHLFKIKQKSLGLAILLLMSLPLFTSNALAWSLDRTVDDPKGTIQLAAAERKVNINKADAATLANLLSGIGQDKAEAIVAWRKQHGRFKSIDQLLEIKGIGEKILAKNRHKLRL